ncbi:hypothetical protein GLOTRDRAFT_113355 [Gloeophyllum trabeum ATCC 11539]|uniref:Uncharacterized protein n=1 Tax=Gloeophyllum trabeum (strain ATCC 11539 / FP-39264 / Madison 617) TaxID=670483 RepID=S7S0F0_GLOTA|nr:uncharacterized protein GLOTRDRAFT_113355 [Gloeophyllum trabeum ATCC 11539]EPQ60825.1 hypothetical protein GLOTRDRAFT_113355 [Gloeophyllum trabeum ATCC 11539]
MPWVLVRPVLWRHSAYVHAFFLLFLFLLAETVHAQTSVNGQVFTSGLAILDAPAPQSVQHAGSNMPIAIDVSGDGKLSQTATIPGSGLPTRYDSLELYLVSSQTSMNLTVSEGTGLLTQESGSTVKHLNWPIPKCLPAGQYNLTLYETSHVNNQGFFSITPIPVTIQNPAPSGLCTDGSNEFLGQPQTSSPPPQNPFLPFPGGPITITLGPSGVIFPSQSTVTQTVTAPPSTVTVVAVSVGTTTFTSVLPGTTQIITSVIRSTETTTALMASGSIDTSGFFPVNGAPSARASSSTVPVIVCSLASLLLYTIV